MCMCDLVPFCVYSIERERESIVNNEEYLPISLSRLV